ncbi:MAG: hypothetical protein K6G58_05655 [Lachnospiraceae bacterium]|nr:hypothetical protein [Lachnospiraceae bacterium]
MQADFHYYATYSAAALAGFSHDECMKICYGAQLVDLCSRSFLNALSAPPEAATTMLRLELMDALTDYAGLCSITRIWSSFHFLPRDLYAKRNGSRRYMNKYRLICGPDGPLVSDTVENAKGQGEEAIGIAMHVIADTWAHAYFAGTPSLVINNTTDDFYEIVCDEAGEHEEKINFRHRPTGEDDIEGRQFTNSLYQRGEHSVMNLGHGRAGHLPDYSYITYRYMPAWADYRVVVKDNPSDYLKAFGQMIHAMRYLRGEIPSFEVGAYEPEAIAPYEEKIRSILCRRQLIASDDWKEFGEALTGEHIEDFDLDKYRDGYINAAGSEKDSTYLGRFFSAATRHKGMVCSRISEAGIPLVGNIMVHPALGNITVHPALGKLAERAVERREAGKR